MMCDSLAFRQKVSSCAAVFAVTLVACASHTAKFSNGADFDHDLRGSGQNCRHLQIIACSNARPAFAQRARLIALSFDALLTWGFAEVNCPSKRLGELRGMVRGNGICKWRRF